MGPELSHQVVYVGIVQRPLMGVAERTACIHDRYRRCR